MERPCGRMSFCSVEAKEACGGVERGRWAGETVTEEVTGSLPLQPQRGSEDDLSLVIMGKPRGALVKRGALSQTQSVPTPPVAQSKNLEIIFDSFLSLRPTFNLLGNSGGSAFKIYTESVQLSHLYCHHPGPGRLLI